MKRLVLAAWILFALLVLAEGASPSWERGLLAPSGGTWRSVQKGMQCYGEDLWNELQSRGSWRSITTKGAPLPRPWGSWVWTGREIIVWGGFCDYVIFGCDPLVAFKNDGGRYNPWFDRWRPTSLVNAPLERASHTAVWAPELGKMLVWGGVGVFDWYNDGGIYNPLNDIWTTIPPAPIAGRDVHTAVWTGREMIVWGGENFIDGALNDGAAYNPRTNAWRLLSMDGAPCSRYFHTAVWTGKEMIVWGGNGGYLCEGGSGTANGKGTEWMFNDGFAYDPEANRWRSISIENAPEGRNLHSAVWTGDHKKVWGATGWDYGEDETFYIRGGGRYNPALDIWMPVPDEGAPSPRRYHSAVWAPEIGRMIIWGGKNNELNVLTRGYGRFPREGGLYAPAGKAQGWSLFYGCHPKPRELANMVWTGNEALFWGGAYGNSRNKGVLLNDGWAYEPSLPAVNQYGGSFLFWNGR